MKDSDKYIESGFLALQQSLDRCYLENIGVNLPLYKVSFLSSFVHAIYLSRFQFEYQKFPLNARNEFFIGLEWIGFMLLVCTSLILIDMVLLPLVEEKVSGIKVSFD